MENTHRLKRVNILQYSFLISNGRDASRHCHHHFRLEYNFKYPLPYIVLTEIQMSEFVRDIDQAGNDVVREWIKNEKR